MHTNFRAFLLNIHVGCCLFSHNITYTQMNQSSEMSLAAIKSHYMRSSIICLTFFHKNVFRSSQRNDDHVAIRFAWMCFVNERYNIFCLTFFFTKMFFELEKKNVDHVVMRFAR